MAITRAAKSVAKPEAKADEGPLNAERLIEEVELRPAQPGLTDARVVPGTSRAERASAIVRLHIPWAVGAGAVPMPGIDLALISAVQIRMLARLCAMYGLPFREELGRSAVGSLLAGLTQYTVSGHLAAAALRFIPIAGPLLGIAVMPAFAAAATFALGKVFITHFESGGTFLQFDPKKVEAHFRAEFKHAGGTVA
jgi:uncharacterized protein (DUF697 family)